MVRHRFETSKPRSASLICCHASHDRHSEFRCTLVENTEHVASDWLGQFKVIQRLDNLPFRALTAVP